jgi:MtN3 and saliva related transmembrane protein
MHTVDIIGLIAGILTSFEAIPQIVRALRTHHTADLSWGMLTMSVIGLALWCIYGIMISDLWIILSTGVTVLLYIVLIIIKWVLDVPKMYRI